MVRSPWESKLDRKEERLAGVNRRDTVLAARALVAKFPWKKYGSMIHIRAGEGSLAVRIALEHKHIQGGGFDEAPLQREFDNYVAWFGLQDRLWFYEGDFLNDPLPAADVLVMGRILSECSGEEQARMVRKAWEALPKLGALIVYDEMCDSHPGNAAQGRYSSAACSSWMRQAGFRASYFQHLAGADSMMAGIK